MVAKVILNPYSARWRAKERFPEAELALKKNGVDFEVDVSERKGHSVELAEQAVMDGFSPIIAAGGDGTIGDVVHGMVKAVPEGEALPPFGVIPLGTANDLMANLKVSTDLDEVAKTIAAGKTRQMDLCKVNDRYFVNNTALGLEPLVTVLQEEITFLKGISRYLYAAVAAIFRGTSWQAELKWDDGEYTGPISFVSIGNGARTGGIFYMTPNADLFDGALTFSYGFVKSRLRMLRFLPLAIKKNEGSFVYKDEFFEIHTRKLSIKLRESSPAHADGEIFDRELYEAEYQIFPGRLPILMP